MLFHQATKVHDTSPIEMQQIHGGATDWSSPNDHGVIFVPSEVFRPNVKPWIEEGHADIACGIDRLDPVVLVVVAPLTGQCQVRQVIGTASASRNDVFDGEGLGTQVGR